MEPNKVFYNPELYLETGTGVKLSKKSLIRGTEQIQPSGKAIIQDGSIVRGDLSNIKLGKYSIIMDGVILHPSYKKSKGQLKFVPISIGECVIIGSGSIISAAKIGNYVYIGKGCIISQRAIISDNVKILDDSYVPADMVIPPFTVYGGKPAIFVSELMESVSQIHAELAVNYYRNFLPKEKEAADKK